MIRLGLRVFLDTNVLFSGFYSEGGPPGEILNLYVRGEITVVVSRQVLEELVVAIREKLPLAISALERLLTGVPPEVVADPPVAESDRARGVINAADAPILAAAIVARPDVFVMCNTSRLRKKGKALSRSVWSLNCLGGIRHVIVQFE